MATLAPSTSQDNREFQTVIMENLSSLYGEYAYQSQYSHNYGKYFTIHYETIIVNLRDIFFFLKMEALEFLGSAHFFLLGNCFIDMVFL
jgi:hypothetical protein